MKKYLCVLALACIGYQASAQQVLTLDSCRALAISNNKELLIGQEKIRAAHYQKRAAFTNYLPKITATGGYIHNQKEVSILNDKQKETLNTFGTQLGGLMQSTVQGIVQKHPQLASTPIAQNLLGSLSKIDIATPLNGIGQEITEAFRTDTRNVYAGALTLTQPLFMGGKIIAYNKITRYAEELSKQQHNTGIEEVIISTDQAYWMVISLYNKKKLAQSYLQLLQKLDNDINKMVDAGVATKADALSVKVKENEAEMNLTKVEDGLSLCKMVLCQLCGLDLSTDIKLADEENENIQPEPISTQQIDMEQVYAKRKEIKSLELATKIYKQKVNVVRADYLPSVALVGNYIVSNPSFYNGFEKKFRGMWNVGVMVKMPIWNWGEGCYKVKAAKAEANIAKYKLMDAKEKIELQVNQSTFKVKEADKKWEMTKNNLEKANENLRYANAGFKEGVIPANNVLAAHTAWLQAQSEKIDAEIDMRMAEIYLQKALGELNVNNLK